MSTTTAAVDQSSPPFGAGDITFDHGNDHDHINHPSVNVTSSPRSIKETKYLEGDVNSSAKIEAARAGSQRDTELNAALSGTTSSRKIDDKIFSLDGQTPWAPDSASPVIRCDVVEPSYGAAAVKVALSAPSLIAGIHAITGTGTVYAATSGVLAKTTSVAGLEAAGMAALEALETGSLLSLATPVVIGVGAATFGLAVHLQYEADKEVANLQRALRCPETPKQRPDFNKQNF